MAKDILYISNGSDVDVAWTGHIVISGDGVSWDGINKVGLSVTKHSVNLNSSAPNSYTERNKENGFVIAIKQGEDTILKFNPAKVLNQSGWNTGAASPAAGALQAMDDILTWLA